MSTIYVAVDVETTGLDPRSDAIIEVGAIVFRDNEILTEYESLINPNQDLPAFITELTGITQDMVDDAPSLFKVRAELRDIIGDHVVVGHNVGFDLGFLREAGLAKGNQRIDTITLASILFPQAGRYNLESLARYLDLPRKRNHRAFADTEQTVELFLALKEKAQELELDQLEEIVRNGENVRTGEYAEWPETLFFQDVLAEKARRAFAEGTGPQKGRLPRLFKSDRLTGQAIIPAEEPELMDEEIVAAMIQPDGNFSRLLDGFEFRPQQVKMLKQVVRALNHADHVLIEAGTGTGKSMAYLLPAAFWASKNGRRVVISTNTINLQDQLINKDIPELQRLVPFQLRAAVRKGRRNYLCTRLFQQMRHSGPSNADEMTLFARILLWLPTTKLADIAEINLRTPGERLAWSRLNGENATCTSDQCAAENCPLHLVRQRAEQAHIVIVNHALLLSDVANGGHILPDFSDLIIDEAHHLEDAVTNGLSFRADKRMMQTALEEVTSSRSGIIADFQRRSRASLPPDAGAEVERMIDELRVNALDAGQRLDDFFITLQFFMGGQVSGHSQFSEQIRLVPSLRTQPHYDEIELVWDGLSKLLHVIVRGFERLAEAAAQLTDSHDFEDGEEMRLTLASHARTLEEIRTNLDAIISDPSDEMIYWADVNKDWISMHAAPLNIGPLVEQHVFQAKESVVLTSATMRTAGPGGQGPGFDYIKQRLCAEGANELAVGSPFDYKNSTLLYLASDIPEPNQPGYQRMLEDAIVDVATSLDGRTMVLFTSYGQLNQTAREIEKRLSQADIGLLAQTSGTSRQQLLAEFKREGGRSVLLGTRSFWEGVDVPGENLQAVIIARLPFDVPSDPIVAARSETFERPFFEYTVPEAVLRFRQGFGRLIRRQSDAGVVAILDKRVMTKRYGSMFLDALPECTVLRKPTGRLGELTVRWLNSEIRRSRSG